MYQDAGLSLFSPINITSFLGDLFGYSTPTRRLKDLNYTPFTLNLRRASPKGVLAERFSHSRYCCQATRPLLQTLWGSRE